MKKQTRDIWRPDMALSCWTSEIGSGGIFWHSAARRIIVRRIASWIEATEKLIRGRREEEPSKYTDPSMKSVLCSTLVAAEEGTQERARRIRRPELLAQPSE
jgi:hypothetical protein